MKKVILIAVAALIIFGAGYFYAESNRPACTPSQAVSDWFWGKDTKATTGGKR